MERELYVNGPPMEVSPRTFSHGFPDIHFFFRRIDLYTSPLEMEGHEE